MNGNGNGTMARKPRRGESIVMLSVNDSPLGVGIAGEDDDDAGDYEGDQIHQDDEEQEDHWDLMQREEAEGATNTDSKGKGKGQGRLVKAPPAPTRQSNRNVTSPTQGASTQKTSSFIPPSTEFTWSMPDYRSTLEQLGQQLENPGAMTEVERAKAQEQLRGLLAMI